MKTLEFKILPKFVWGGRPAKRTPVVHVPSQGVAIHWVGPALGYYSEASAKYKVQAIQAYHMDSKGWSDIAYNFFVDRYGNVYEGRGWNVANGAQGGYYNNREYYAICYLGGIGEQFTEEAKAAINMLILMGWSKGAGRKVVGHKDLKATSCPGPDIYSWIYSGRPSNVKIVLPGHDEIVKEVEELMWIARATDEQGRQRNALVSGVFKTEFVSVAAMNEARKLGAEIQNVSWEFFSKQLVDARV